MKLFLSLFLCLFVGFNLYSQTEKAEIGVEEIALFRSDGKGNVGEATDKFTTIDRPIYCSVTLDSTKTAAVKMIIVAARAAGLKPETKVVTVNYATKENQNQIVFDASPNGVWAAGSYRADVYVNGKLAKSLAFEIEKSAKETAPVKAIRKRLKN